MKGFVGICLLGSMIILMLVTTSLAQDVKVPFLFREDEKLDQTDFMNLVQKSRDFEADPYLQAPMTRLEYMLMMLEARLKVNENKVRHELVRGFETVNMKIAMEVFSITSRARYDSATGRVVVSYTVTKLGRPKRPMRTTCDNVLFLLNSLAPQKNPGFLYHNTVLGVLQHEEYPTYTPALQTLAKSIVHTAFLQSQSDDGRVSHTLGCLRTGEDAPILYHRDSFSLGK